MTWDWKSAEQRGMRLINTPLTLHSLHKSIIKWQCLNNRGVCLWTLLKLLQSQLPICILEKEKECELKILSHVRTSFQQGAKEAPKLKTCVLGAGLICGLVYLDSVHSLPAQITKCCCAAQLTPMLQAACHLSLKHRRFLGLKDWGISTKCK